MSIPAARVGDNHICPLVDPGPKPHVGGPILPPGATTVTVEGQPAARVGDQAQCAGPPDSIVVGAFPVPIEGKPAARTGDSTAHGGVIAAGAATVVIGSAGVSGNPWAGRDACQAAAKGRFSGSTKQSAQNCGIESSRQVINQATGKAVREKPLLNRALREGWAKREPTWRDSGGSGPEGRLKILESQGVSSTVEPQGMKTIELAVAEGKGVITSHDPGLLWNDPRYYGQGHAITVTGVEYDENGKPTKVYINDTGTGECQKSIPADQFNDSLRAGRGVNVTKSRIW